MSKDPFSEPFEARVAPLLALGLVGRTGQALTSPEAYRLTEDGVRYIDAMFRDGTDCLEHPDITKDLNGVSRGRVIYLKLPNLVALAALLLGRECTGHVYTEAERLAAGDAADGVLLTVAGSVAHGLRHAAPQGALLAVSVDEELKVAAAVSREQIQRRGEHLKDPLRPLLEAAVHTWPQSLVDTVRAALVRAAAQAAQSAPSVTAPPPAAATRPPVVPAKRWWEFWKSAPRTGAPQASPNRARSSQHAAGSKEVLGLLVLTRSRLNNAQGLLEQILDQQRANGHSVAAGFTAKVGTANDPNDIAYVYARVRSEFSHLGEHDLMERTRQFPFQASDGNAGNYYVIFDRP